MRTEYRLFNFLILKEKQILKLKVTFPLAKFKF